MNDGISTGTAGWVRQTGGHLSGAERRALLLPLMRAQARNALGRLSLVTHLDSGRHHYIPPARLLPPDTALTRAAAEAARGILPIALLNHSYRAYLFGRALGELEGLEVDEELLFAGALLHDVGLVRTTGDVDFTLASARLAEQVADEVGLSTAATEVMQTAITMHYSPGVSPSAGPVAYLLSAGAAVDVVGLRSWELPRGTLTDAVREYPRADFKKVFTTAFQQEAARVPQGRARLLHRYGAFTAAIRFAPFDE